MKSFTADEKYASVWVFLMMILPYVITIIG